MILRCLTALTEGSQEPRQRAVVGYWAHRDFARLPSSRSSNARSVGAQPRQTSNLQKPEHLCAFTNSCGEPYFQSLEAVVPIEGSYPIALYAAVLLGASSRDRATRAPEVFQFIEDMHTLRNEVVHGRLDKVLEGRLKTKNKLNVALLRNYVHELAILYLLNPNEQGNRGLCPLAHRLALGEPAVVKTLYEPPPGQ